MGTYVPYVYRRNLGGTRGRVSAPAISFSRGIVSLGYWVEDGLLKIAIYAKRLFGWCKERQIKNLRFYRTQRRDILISVVVLAPPPPPECY
jgi:hypothetical protein